MALLLLLLRYFSYVYFLIALYSLFLNPCHCLNLKSINVSNIENEEQWSLAAATWYGRPDGAGSDEGACGYGDAVDNPPFSKFVSAGGPSLFNAGKGCGACYEVKCTEKGACSGKAVTVVVADECPGCTSEPVHFDLSGSAFGAMANPGQADALRNIGVLKVQSRRVACNYGVSISFQVDGGSNPYYFAAAIEYENGDADLLAVELKQALESDLWLPMQQSWGATWQLNSGSQLRAPFSIKLTEAGKSPNTIVATNVIPDGWLPGHVYRSLVNFKGKAF